MNKGTPNEYIRLKAGVAELVGCGNVTFTLKDSGNAITLQGVDAKGNIYDVPKFMLVSELWNYPSGIGGFFKKVPARTRYVGRAGLGSGTQKFGFDYADYHISLYEITKAEQAGAKAESGGVAVVVGQGTQPTQWTVQKRPLTQFVNIEYKGDINCGSAPEGALHLREGAVGFPGNVLSDFQAHPVSSMN